MCKKMPYILPTDGSYGDFLNWGSLLTRDFSLCQVNIKLLSTMSKEFSYLNNLSTLLLKL